MMPRPLLTAAAAALTALSATGCGGDDPPGGSTKSETPAAAPTQAPPPPAQGAPAGVQLKVVSSQYGRVVADDKGEALYLFDKESAGRAECYDDCAKAWPPALTKGKPEATAGLEQKLLGTTRRSDGKLQVTYKGHPLYYYEGDAPGRILCQNVDEFGGLWLVVKPSGDPVT